MHKFVILLGLRLDLVLGLLLNQQGVHSHVYQQFIIQRASPAMLALAEVTGSAALGTRNPALQVKVDEHEGRHRMAAWGRLQCKHIPIMLKLNDALREHLRHALEQLGPKLATIKRKFNVFDQSWMHGEPVAVLQLSVTQTLRKGKMVHFATGHLQSLVLGDAQAASEAASEDEAAATKATKATKATLMTAPQSRETDASGKAHPTHKHSHAHNARSIGTVGKSQYRKDTEETYNPASTRVKRKLGTSLPRSKVARIGKKVQSSEWKSKPGGSESVGPAAPFESRGGQGSRLANKNGQGSRLGNKKAQASWTNAMPWS